MLKKILIPAILATTKKELRDKIEGIEDYIEFIQVDYMDGKFVPYRSRYSVDDLYRINPVPKQEVHLMVNQPEDIIEDWISAGVEKIIIHVESEFSWEKIREIYHDNYFKLYFAINPNTPINRLDRYIKEIDGITVMGVDPGQGHQKFQAKVLGKITKLRQENPKLNIQVDGGMHLEPTNTIRQVLLAGANEIVVGSEIFLSKDPIQRIEDLEYFINNFK